MKPKVPKLTRVSTSNGKQKLFWNLSDNFVFYKRVESKKVKKFFGGETHMHGNGKNLAI